MITLVRAAEITKSCIEGLRPEFKFKALNWYDLCIAEKLIPYVYEGMRSVQRQNELYAQGRTTEGKIITKAKGCQSFHQYGLAFDWVPLTRHEKALGFYEADWDNEAAYKISNKIADKVGLRYLSWETPHLEDASFTDWRQLKDIFGCDDA